MDEDPVTSLLIGDIHVTDVLLRTVGQTFHSVLRVDRSQGKVLVRDTEGREELCWPSDFCGRWPLSKTGGFRITWRVSPIDLPKD